MIFQALYAAAVAKKNENMVAEEIQNVRDRSFNLLIGLVAAWLLNLLLCWETSHAEALFAFPFLWLLCTRLTAKIK